jgi:hypothetical protein
LASTEPTDQAPVRRVVERASTAGTGGSSAGTTSEVSAWPRVKEPCTWSWVAEPASVLAVAGPRRARRMAAPDFGP